MTSKIKVFFAVYLFPFPKWKQRLKISVFWPSDYQFSISNRKDLKLLMSGFMNTGYFIIPDEQLNTSQFENYSNIGFSIIL